MSQTDILFVHNHPARFVKIDRALLQSHWTVREWFQRGRMVNLPELRSAVASSRLVFGWFASWHTFWPTLLARRLLKPVVLVIGGYDVASMPAIGYDRRGIRRWVSRWTIRNSTALTTFSEFSRNEAATNLEIPAETIKTIYLGVPDAFAGTTPKVKERLVLTVGNVDRENLLRKGLKDFVEAGARLRDVRLMVVGKWRDDAIKTLRSLASPNVEFTGELDDASLVAAFATASTYVQASRHEGFGLALAEAMLARCIPVSSTAGSLPEVVGGTGLYLQSVDAAAIAEAVRAAFGLDGEVRRSARERILSNFSLTRRERALADLVESQLDRRL
jgi:glycosyltransferase involved in cell wall biosynthesis